MNVEFSESLEAQFHKNERKEVEAESKTETMIQQFRGNEKLRTVVEKQETVYCSFIMTDDNLVLKFITCNFGNVEKAVEHCISMLVSPFLKLLNGD
jgi:hypothetical protein